MNVAVWVCSGGLLFARLVCLVALGELFAVILWCFLCWVGFEWSLLGGVLLCAVCACLLLFSWFMGFRLLVGLIVRLDWVYVVGVLRVMICVLI